MRIGELAKKVGVSTRAIRYYERIGLLGKTHRSASGYRIYSEESIAFLLFLKKAQKAGFTLQEIKTIWEIRSTGKKPCDYVKEQAWRKVQEIEQKIRELEELRATLADMQEGWKALEPLEYESRCICPLIEGIKTQ
ncbi:MAG: heavy metal-responsive transcriptional regulator [Thermodesulfobacteriota bacterium]